MVFARVITQFALRRDTQWRRAEWAARLSSCKLSGNLEYRSARRAMARYPRRCVAGHRGAFSRGISDYSRPLCVGGQGILQKNELGPSAPELNCVAELKLRDLRDLDAVDVCSVPRFEIADQ
jgi:hypothetical protein